jgi:ferredoxin
MPLATFSSPGYKDRTVYAAAGSHTETSPKPANQYQVPMDCECEDDECGACAVRVTSVDRKQRTGYHLTEKEKGALRALGRLGRDELEKRIVGDLSSDWRLACQMIVRDEDMPVQY